MDATYEQLEQAALVESLRHLENDQKKKASVDTDNSPSKKATATNFTSNLPSDDDVKSPAVASASACASIPAAASMPSAASFAQAPSPLRSAEDYSQSVQDLVMNGFQLKDVVKAYDLVGDNFDAMLTFLLANPSS